VSPPFSFSFLNNELLIGPSLGKKRKKKEKRKLWKLMKIEVSV